MSNSFYCTIEGVFKISLSCLHGLLTKYFKEKDKKSFLYLLLSKLIVTSLLLNFIIVITIEKKANGHVEIQSDTMIKKEAKQKKAK